MHKGKALSPLAAGAILLLFGGLGGAIFWLYSLASELPRLTHLRLDPEGRLHAMLGSELYRFDREGKCSQRIDLGRLGASGRIGGFAFFLNGDLLLRQGPDPRSLWFNIQRFLRHTNTTPDTSVPGADGGLIRCRLEDQRCRPFGEPPLNLNDAFHLDVDWATDRVFLASSSRHRIQVFDAEGQRLAQLEQGLRFPNQLVYLEGRLYLANTNRHEISVFELEADRLQPRPEQGFRTDPRGAELGPNVWPSALLLSEQETWVVNSDREMARGLGLRFSPKGRLLGRLAAPAGADIFSLVRFGDQVLASDYARNRIYRFDLGGEFLGDFDAGPMDRRIADLERQRGEYRWWMHWLIGLFVVALVAGIALGVRQEFAGLPAAPPPMGAADPSAIRARNSIQWIEPTVSVQRQARGNWVLFGCLALPIIVVFWLRRDVFSLQIWLACGLLLLLWGWFAWFQQGLGRQRIGVDGGLLILRDGRGRYAEGEGARIRYAPDHLMIDGVAVWLRTPTPVFPTASLVTQVYPLLKEAESVSPREMQWLRIRSHPYKSLAIALGVMLVAGALLWR